MDLDGTAHKLYALAPGEFMAHRSALQNEARAAGDRALATAIGALRRPTVAAWLVNRLIRSVLEPHDSGPDDEPDDEPDVDADDARAALAEIERLESLGEELRDSQARLDGPAMKRLAQQRHDLVASLVRRAAGQEAAAAGGDRSEAGVSAAVRRELEETFGAAIADEQARAAVTSGRLTRALAYSGFGDVDISAATATPLAADRAPALRTRPRAPRGDSADAAGRGSTAVAGRGAAEASSAVAAVRARALEAVEQAGTQVSSARQALDGASRHLDELRAEEVRLSAQLEELQDSILRTRRELDLAGRASAAAEREHGRSEKRLQEAETAARRAAEALAAL